MNVNMSQSDLLKHLSFWHNKTDDECIEMATGEFGVDAEQALLNILERDLCTDINNNVVRELNKTLNV
jgi:hypothetical protein